MINIYDRQQLAAYLKSKGFHTDKSLGQNYLCSEAALKQIVDAAEIKSSDHIIEIGPGLGHLSKIILEQNPKKLTALEFDKRVIPLLKEQCLGDSRLEIIEANALKYHPQLESYKIIANIPYYLSSPLLRHLLTTEKKASMIILLLQKEVVEKICAKENSILSLQVKLYAECKNLGIIKKDLFFPAPKVDSAILALKTYGESLIQADFLDIFWQTTKLAFSKKRKKLKNTLGNCLVNKEKSYLDLMQELGISPEKRPQELKIADWKALTESIARLKKA